MPLTNGFSVQYPAGVPSPCSTWRRPRTYGLPLNRLMYLAKPAEGGMQEMTAVEGVHGMVLGQRWGNSHESVRGREMASRPRPRRGDEINQRVIPSPSGQRWLAISRRKPPVANPARICYHHSNDR